MKVPGMTHHSIHQIYSRGRLFILHQPPSTFAPVIVTAATRGHHLTIHINMGLNKLPAQTTFMALFLGMTCAFTIICLLLWSLHAKTKSVLVLIWINWKSGYILQFENNGNHAKMLKCSSNDAILEARDPVSSLNKWKVKSMVHTMHPFSLRYTPVLYVYNPPGCITSSLWLVNVS